MAPVGVMLQHIGEGRADLLSPFLQLIMLEIIKQETYETTEFAHGHRNPDIGPAIIDGDSLLYHCLDKETFEAMKLKFDERMLNLLYECGTDTYVAVLSPKVTFRNSTAVSKPYKGNRSGKSTPPELQGLKAYAKKEWGFFLPHNVEADDMMAPLQETFGGTICSPDKDVLKQIPGTHFNYQKLESVMTTEDDAWRFLWMQVVMGDSTDGVPGIPGIGEKKAEAALGPLPSDKLPLKALQMYLAHEGWSRLNAVDKFKETFDLVKILQNKVDLEKHMQGAQLIPGPLNARKLCLM
jgi:hypothetical protein